MLSSHPTATQQRAHAWEQLTTSTWDIVVVGGGATGLGVAVDAAARGYRTLLLEAHDFAKGTSSKTTKLIHGGVRYLAQGNIALVQEALKERQYLLKNAPHVVQPLEFIIPTYQCWDTPVYTAGLKMYDLLAGAHDLPRSQRLSAAQVQQKLPNIRSQNLKAGLSYYDAQFDDTRLAITLVRTIQDLGGLALNYAPVIGFESQGNDIQTIQVQDALTQKTVTIQASCIVNAAGVWVDQIRQLLDTQLPSTVRPSKGVHIVLDARFMPGAQALMIPKTADGRVLFAVPWHGALLVGTTDTAQSDTPIDPQATTEDIDFILRTVNQYLTQPATRSDIRSVWAGLRPLIQPSKATDSRSISREHHIAHSHGRLLTVTGGKWTTYRKMAADVIQTAIEHQLLTFRPACTEHLRLHGAYPHPSPAFLPYYGTDTPILQALPGWEHRLEEVTGLTEAHIRYAVRYEAAQTVEDVLARRSRLLFLDAQRAIQIAPQVAAIMASELEQDTSWQNHRVAEFLKVAQTYLVEVLVSPTSE